MDMKDINKIEMLVKLFEASALETLEVRDGDFSVVMKKPSLQPSAAFTNAAACPENISRTADELPAAAPAANLHAITSPLAGVFYDSPSPDDEPFVKVGDKVKKGDTLCLIESMKVMNELTADTDGEIAEICAENGQIVEYSQVIYRIK